MTAIRVEEKKTNLDRASCNSNDGDSDEDTELGVKEKEGGEGSWSAKRSVVEAEVTLVLTKTSPVCP